MGPHPPRLLFIAPPENRHCRTPEIECPDLLKILTFKKQGCLEYFIKAPGGKHGCPVNKIPYPVMGFDYLGKGWYMIWHGKMIYRQTRDLSTRSHQDLLLHN